MRWKKKYGHEDRFDRDLIIWARFIENYELKKSHRRPQYISFTIFHLRDLENKVHDPI